MKEKFEVLSFDFEEVNAAVFRNAQIRYRKKNNDVKTLVIVPSNFTFLFKDSDKVLKISEKTLKQFNIPYYFKILEYLGTRFELSFKERWNRLIWFVSSFFLKGRFSIFLNNSFRSIRHRKFYVENGLERKCLNFLKQRIDKFIYLRGSDYLDYAVLKNKCDSFDIHFVNQFKYLYQMIAEGDLYDIDLTDDKINFENEKFKKFINYSGKKYLIRTRNFKNKATGHNSSKEVFEGLTREILLDDPSSLVLNIGIPVLSLDIDNDRYLEFEGGISIELEMLLCKAANACVMTAEAGLFTAFAATNINLVQIDNEWSETELPEKIKLFEARRKAGISDIDVREELKSLNFGKAIQKINESQLESRKVVSNKFKNVEVLTV